MREIRHARAERITERGAFDEKIGAVMQALLRGGAFFGSEGRRWGYLLSYYDGAFMRFARMEFILFTF